jgi:hypothetical protein
MCVYSVLQVVTTPLLSSRSCDAKVSEVNGTIGISIEPEQMCLLCNKMQLGPAEYIGEMCLYMCK